MHLNNALLVENDPKNSGSRALQQKTQMKTSEGLDTGVNFPKILRTPVFGRTSTGDSFWMSEFGGLFN